MALGCTWLVTRRVTERRAATAVNLAADAGLVAGTDTAPATAPSLQQALGGVKVKDLAGRLAPLLVEARPTIVMVNSRTCPWCKKALKDMGEMAEGRPIPHLTLLTLEGAAYGEPMLAQEKLTGARLVGPATSEEETKLSLRVSGTPTFLAVDRNGRVVRTIPGYPIRPELEHLFRVMTGESDTP